MTDREKIVKLKGEGLTHAQIAAKLDYSVGKVTYQLHLKPKNLVCIICGKEFVAYSQFGSKTCDDEDCRRKHRRANSSKNSKERFEYTEDEPYSDIVNSFIVEDILLGKSIKEMSRVYSRHPKHLEKHIKENLKQDVMEKYVRNFSEYQKEKVRRATNDKLREIREMGK